MNFLPGLSILGVFLLLSVILIYKFKSTEIIQLLEGKNFFLYATLVIIFLILSFYLFMPNNEWVSDLLKIAIGVFVGVGATTVKEKQYDSSNFLNDLRIKGNDNKIVGRDLIETIQNIDKAFGDIKDSIVQQNHKIEQKLNSNLDLDQCIHMIYDRSNILEIMQEILTKRIEEGWALLAIEAEYQYLDGIVLVFTREKVGEKAMFSLFRGANFQQLVP
jgi:hypothetical protein